MFTRLSAFVMMFILVWIVHQYPWRIDSTHAGAMAIALGLVILGGYLFGEILVPLKLPRISGYLFMGMILGPYCTGLLSHETVRDFRLIDQIALALIALSAGGELHITSIQKRLRGIVTITLSQSIGIFLLATCAFLLISRFIPFLNDLSVDSRLAASMVFGVISVAQSPATTIAVITETRSAGVSTETMLGVAVIKDVLVIVMFTILISVVKSIELGSGFEWAFLLNLGGEIVISFAAGILAGWIISFYLKYIQVNPVLFVLAFCFFVSEGSKTFHLDTLIVCIVAGFWVTNASKRGKELIEMIEESSLIIYVIFFCLTGASLNLDALSNALVLTLSLVVLRMFFLYGTTLFGSWISGESFPSPHTFWMAFLPQAGVSLGLVTIIQREGISWGEDMRTIIVAVIALNQIIGPITMKIALQQSGEIGAHKKQKSENKKTQNAESPA